MTCLGELACDFHFFGCPVFFLSCSRRSHVVPRGACVNSLPEHQARILRSRSCG
ncbi:hypothetical protein AIOL_002013 [Candidatus Rhodobacter oscarellae]|uniref:Uncharacterized protein n=1 Tax=Candidatus Rhodobacter oscarellae TaxID=1675527 RepID=A0A0J9E2U7_9RHOB|nr:hypothetical protein AIOL_002013 [Candidatus Rhodobacter lobularis]